MGLRQNLRNVRKERGLSQEQLACMVCVSRQTISKWESGESYPSSFHIVTLAKRLNCDINVLIGNDEIVSVEDANSNTSLPKVGLLKSILPRACFTALVGLFVAVLCFFFAGQQPFIIQCGYLPVQLTSGPCAISRLIHIPRTGFLVFHTQQSSVM